MPLISREGTPLPEKGNREYNRIKVAGMLFLTTKGAQMGPGQLVLTDVWKQVNKSYHFHRKVEILMPHNVVIMRMKETVGVEFLFEPAEQGKVVTV